MRKAIVLGLIAIGVVCFLIGMVTGAYQIGGTGIGLIVFACVLAVLMKVVSWAIK